MNRGEDSLKNGYANCLPLKSHALSTNTTQPGPILLRALLYWRSALSCTSSPAVQLLGSSSSTRIAAFNSSYSAPRLGNVGSTQVLLYAPHLLFPRVPSVPYPPAFLPRCHVLVQSTMTGKSSCMEIKALLVQFNSIHHLPPAGQVTSCIPSAPGLADSDLGCPISCCAPSVMVNLFPFFFILFHALPG